MVSQARQENRSRTVWITFQLRGTTSRVSVTSSPSLDSLAPQQGQAEGAVEPGEPERVGFVLFATIQGIAALVTGGMVQAEQLDALVADAIAHFLRGSRAPA